MHKHNLCFLQFGGFKFIINCKLLLLSSHQHKSFHHSRKTSQTSSPLPNPPPKKKKPVSGTHLKIQTFAIPNQEQIQLRTPSSHQCQHHFLLQIHPQLSSWGVPQFRAMIFAFGQVCSSLCCDLLPAPSAMISPAKTHPGAQFEPSSQSWVKLPEDKPQSNARRDQCSPICRKHLEG